MPKSTADDLFNTYAEVKRAEFVKKADDIFGFDNPKEIVKHTVPYALGGAGIGALLGVLREYLSADDTATGTNMDALKTILTGALLGAGTGTSLGYFTADPRYRTLKKDAQDDSTQEDVDDNVTPTAPIVDPTATTTTPATTAPTTPATAAPTTPATASTTVYDAAVSVSEEITYSVAERLSEVDPIDLAGMLPQPTSPPGASGMLTPGGHEEVPNLALAERLIEAGDNYVKVWGPARATRTVLQSQLDALEESGDTKLLNEYGPVTFHPEVRTQLSHALTSGDGVEWLEDPANVNPIAMVTITNLDKTTYEIPVPYTKPGEIPTVLESTNFNHNNPFRLSDEAAARRAATIQFSQPTYQNLTDAERQEKINTLTKVLMIPKWAEGLEAGGDRAEVLTGWIKGPMRETLGLTRAFRETDMFVSPDNTFGGWEVYHRGEDGERRLGGYTKGYVSSVLNLNTENVLAGGAGIGAGLVLQHPNTVTKLLGGWEYMRKPFLGPSHAKSVRMSQEFLHNLVDIGTETGVPLTPENIVQLNKQYKALRPEHQLAFREFEQLMAAEANIRVTAAPTALPRPPAGAPLADWSKYFADRAALNSVENFQKNVAPHWANRRVNGSLQAVGEMTQAERLQLMTPDAARTATGDMHKQVNPKTVDKTKTNILETMQSSRTMRGLRGILRYIGGPAALGVAGYQGYRAATDPKGPLVFDRSSLKDRPREPQPNPYLSRIVGEQSSPKFPEIPDLNTIYGTLYPQ